MYLYSEWLELFHTRIYRMGAPGPKYEHRLVVVKIASKTLLVSPATATCQRPQRHHKAQLGVPSRRGRLATVPTPPVRILSGIGPPGPPYGSHCGVVCPHSPFTEFVRPCVSLVPLSGVAVRPISTLCLPRLDPSHCGPTPLRTACSLPMPHAGGLSDATLTLHALFSSHRKRPTTEGRDGVTARGPSPSLAGRYCRGDSHGTLEPDPCGPS
jgi:hypothetical protein